MYNKYSQSLMDYLMLVVKDMPSLDQLRLHFKGKGQDPNAKNLYNLWSDADNKISNRKFRRPADMTESDIKKLESSGLVEMHGRDLRVTAKGEKALREMILADDTFQLNKRAGSSNMVKTASSLPKAKDWYTRLTDEDIAS